MQFIIDPEVVNRASRFSSGLVRVNTVDYENDPTGFGKRLYGYLNRNGELQIDIQFESASAFRGPLARVKHGYIDSTGNYVWRER